MTCKRYVCNCIHVSRNVGANTKRQNISSKVNTPKFCTHKNFPLYSTQNIILGGQCTCSPAGPSLVGSHGGSLPQRLQSVPCVCVCVCVCVCMCVVCVCVCVHGRGCGVCRVGVLIGLCPCFCIKMFREINSQKQQSKWYSCSTTSLYSGWVYKLVKALKLGSLQEQKRHLCGYWSYLLIWDVYTVTR